MTSLKKAIIYGTYILLKTKIIINQNISIRAPLSAAHIDIFQFIQKIIFTTIHVPQIDSL